MAAPPRSDGAPADVPPRPFLVLTTALCGAVVMVVEVLGSRIQGPFFGVSLFVWTSLISVTLVALATGYAAGGRLADGENPRGRLYGIVLAAGLSLLIVPLIRAPVLRACMALGLRGGSLASALLLFGPPLALLGCVSPLVVRLAAERRRDIGKTVGTLAAISTLGSFAGTILTGFVLVAHFGVDRIFQILGATLVLLAVADLALLRGHPRALLLLPLVLVPQPHRTTEKTLPNGTKVTQLLAADGFYGRVQVLDYSSGPSRVRELTIDGLIQGGIDVRDGQSVYPYPYFLELLPYGTNPRGTRCLVLGLGAGVVPAWYEARGVATDVVEIDPRILEIAREHFGLAPRASVVLSDARTFLHGSTQSYDYIVCDVATGDWAPIQLLSLEAFALMKARLTPQGILAINLIGSLGERPLVTASVVATLEQLFGTVKTYVTIDPARGIDVQNVEILAHDDPGLAFDVRRVASFPIHEMVEADVRAALGKEHHFPAGTPAIVLRDDYNPSDVFDLPVKESIRRGLLGYTDWDLLL